MGFNQSYRVLEDVLNEITLSDFQTVDLVRSLLFKNNILVYDPGLGKTVMAAAIIKCFINEARSRRFIMVVQKSQLDQTPQKIKKWTGLDVLTTSAASAQIDRAFFSQNSLRYPILMITHETLNDVVAMRALLSNKEYYYGIIVDEAHELCNFTDASSSEMLRAILRRFPVKYGLTATPVTTNPKQIVQLAHMFAPELVDNFTSMVRDVSNGAPIMDNMPDLFIRRTRLDLGISNNYKTHIEVVEAHPHQEGASGTEMFTITKGPGAQNQADKVLEIIRKQRSEGRRGLVYVHRHACREWLLETLGPAGVRYACINGKTPSTERKLIFDDFAKGNLDVVLTSVTTALDLDCEYVIFYEYSRSIKQMLGRAERGLNPKTVHLHFIFTRNTEEVATFMKGIYATSMWIQEVLRQDYSMLLAIGDSLSRQRG